MSRYIVTPSIQMMAVIMGKQRQELAEAAAQRDFQGIEETKEPNGVYEAEYKYILAIYEKCQREKDFL